MGCIEASLSAASDSFVPSGKADKNPDGSTTNRRVVKLPGSIGTDGFGPGIGLRTEVHHGLVAASQDGEGLANLPNPRACRRRPEVTRSDTVGPLRGSGGHRFPDGFPSRINTPGDARPPDDGRPISCSGALDAQGRPDHPESLDDLDHAVLNSSSQQGKWNEQVSPSFPVLTRAGYFPC